MFFIKKLLTSIIIPPGLFIIILLVIAFVKKRKVATIASITCAIALYALSIEPVKDILYLQLENKVKKFEPIIYANQLNNTDNYHNRSLTLKSIDAIVILGGGVYENGNFKEDSANRLLAGYFLYTLTGKPIILSGGSAGLNIKESYTMYSVLHYFNVKRQDIIIESQSRDTDDNAKYVVQICTKQLFKTIALVTSAYHMPRAYTYFNKAEFTVIPVFCDSKVDMRYSVYSFIPTFSSLANSTKALREYVALAVVWLTGSF